MNDASPARGFYVTQYFKLQARYANRDDKEEQSRAVAFEMTKSKFGEEAATKAQAEYHKGS